MKFAIAAAFMLVEMTSGQAQPNKDQSMGICTVEALRLFPGHTEADEVGTWKYEMACMQAKGYKFDNSAEICWQGNLYGEARCYQ